MKNRHGSLVFALLAMAAASANALAREHDSPVALPFVGCAEDGMTGPVSAPTPNGRTPVMPPAVAAQLAYYASEALAVVAPRGWHCVGTYGSGGSALLVTPEPHDTDDFSRSGFKIDGPVVLVTRFIGSTSGRFDVAKIAAPLFPSATRFVRSVIAEGIEPASSFKRRPSPRDVITHRGANAVVFITLGGVDGLGTGRWIATSAQPVQGAVILLPSADMDLVKLQVRMSPQQQSLSPPIREYTLQTTAAAWVPLGIQAR